MTQMTLLNSGHMTGVHLWQLGNIVHKPYIFGPVFFLNTKTA